MRLFLLHAFALLVALVAASDHLVANARVRAIAPTEAPLHSLDRRWCFFFICFGETTTKTSSTSAKPSATPSPSVSPSPTAPIVTSSVAPSSSVAPTATASASPTTDVSPSATNVPSSSASTTTFEQTTTSYWYSQPPLPAKTVSAPASLFTVSDASIPPLFKRTRKYTFTIDYASGAPSGFQRSMMVINNMYPAPLVEAWEGDTLEITVHNRLHLGQSIHWHGMRQNRTNSEDGIPGISQCSIPPGGSYTYRFTLDSGELGTYWYHSHYANTLADGITGMLIVHSRKQPMRKGIHYDDEMPQYVTDWMNDQSEEICHGLLDEKLGYRGSSVPPDPDAILLNGIGQSDCAVAQKDVKCFVTGPSITKVKRGNKVRFRLVNMGAHATIRYSIDKHVLTLVEVDDTPVQPIDVHEVTLAPGQRYSVIVNMNQGKVGESFWIRATTASGCLNPLHVITTKGILWYTDFFGLTWLGKGVPNTQPWADLHNATTAPCLDTDEEYDLVPSIVENSPATAVMAGKMDSAFGRFVHPDGSGFIGFGYNDITFVNYINNPLLSQVEKGLELNQQHVAALTFNSPSPMHAVDFIINNLDPSFLAHPFHLHGRPFHIIHRGKGALDPKDIPSLPIKTNNPIRRDTLVIQGGEYALLRIITDNPGVWPIHCHIGWHLAAGKLGVFVIRPDEVKKQRQTAAWSGLCAGTDINEIGPAKRRGLPPQSRAVYDVQARYAETEEEEEEPKYPGGVRDFTPIPHGLTRGEYLSNGTHWWVAGMSLQGEIPVEHQVPQKRHWLEARTLFMNATHWWVPGTVFVGELKTPIDTTQAEVDSGVVSDVASNVVIVSENMVVPGPGDALVEPAEIIGGVVAEVGLSVFENTLPIGYKPPGASGGPSRPVSEECNCSTTIVELPPATVVVTATTTTAWSSSMTVIKPPGTNAPAASTDVTANPRHGQSGSSDNHGGGYGGGLGDSHRRRRRSHRSH